MKVSVRLCCALNTFEKCAYCDKRICERCIGFIKGEVHKDGTATIAHYYCPYCYEELRFA